MRIAAPEDDGAVVAMVLDGRSELGLTELRPHRDELVAVSLERQELVAVCPPRTRLASSGRLPVARLRGMPLVTTPPGSRPETSSTGRWPRPASSPSSRSRPRSARRSRRSCSAGPARRSSPARLAEPLAAQGAVVARLVPTLTRTIGLVHRPSPLTPGGPGVRGAGPAEAPQC